jgi:hypothetical protein
MADHRTIWRAKPCGWRDRERVVALGDEFGPAGPLVLDFLEELAKEQRCDGSVRAGLRSIARGAFLARGSEGLALARRILAFAATVKALDELEIADGDEMRVTCRVSGFGADQGTGGAAVRKAHQRAAGPAVTDRDAVTSCHKKSDGVTSGHLTGEERKEDPPFPPASGGTTDEEVEVERIFPMCPAAPSSRRSRDAKRHDAEMQAWRSQRLAFAAAHFHDQPPDAVLNMAVYLAHRRITPTVQNIRRALQDVAA